MRKYFLLIYLLFCLLLSSCFNITKLNDFEWIYRDTNDEAQKNAWTASKYLIWTKSDSIFVQSKSNIQCQVLDIKGKVIDTIPFDTTQMNANWIAIGNESRLNVWHNKVFLKDSSNIISVEYISRRNGPLRFRGPAPKRERFIKFKTKNKDYLIRLPLFKGEHDVYDIRQLNSTKFVISFSYIYDRDRNATGYAIGLLDLNKFVKRRYLE
jgi:hypothetical protein